MTSPHAFLPAMRFHFLTPLYEPIVWLFMCKMWRFVAEEASRRATIGGNVADLGCGPGSILRRIRKLRSDLTLTGTDIDPVIISIAKRKVHSKDIAFSVASIEKTPFSDASQDVVISTIMFHHLNQETKRAAFSEVRRILHPGGTFLLCDFSAPTNEHWQLNLRWWRWMEPEIIPQLRGELLELGRHAGAKAETLRSFYCCIAVHAFMFE